MPYRPFGDSPGIPRLPVGDQWPDPPAELRAAVDPPLDEDDYNRFERAIYRWLADPHVLPRRWRRRRRRDV